MRASQLFAVCRERFRRVRNPQAVNENVSFIVMPGKQVLPSNNSAGFWYQNSPDQGGGLESFIVGPKRGDQPARWTYNQLGAFPNWRRIWATSADEGGKDSMLLPYNHRQKTGELYVRCSFLLLSGPTDAANSLPIFAIHDILTGQREFVIFATRNGDNVTFSANYYDNDDNEQILYSHPEPLTKGGKTSYVFDVRVGLHGVDKTADPFIQVYRPEFGVYSDARLQGYPGSGYRDLTGAKLVAWCSETLAGTIPAGDIRPSRLGIGNLIKEALP